MSAANFPSLTINPAYPLSEQREKTGLTTKSEYGYVHGRKRFTMARTTFGLSYPLIDGYDKALLEAHADEADVAETFYWRHPWTLVWHLVRYAEIPKFELIHGGGGYWQTQITLASARLAAIEDDFGDADVWGDAAAAPIDVWGYSA